MASKLEIKRAELTAKQDELHAIFAKYPDLDMPANVAEEVKTRNDELSALGKEYEALAEMDRIQKETAAAVNGHKAHDPARPALPGGGSDGPAAKPMIKSIGEAFMKSGAITRKDRDVEVSDFDVKTLFETGAGWAPESTRTGTVILSAQRTPNLFDLIPNTPTSQVAYVYMEETTFTNAAAETAEGGTFPEAALALTEKSSPVKKIAVWLPVTDEQLEDVAGIQTYIESRLTLMLRQRLESQMINGDGTGENLTGLFNIVGIQTQAKGADPTPDAFYKAMTKIRVNAYAEPNGIIMHPNDWQDIRLLRTSEGIYIWGSPTETGPERLWGLPVRQNTAVPEGSGGVMDSMYFLTFNKAGIEFKLSDSHSDFFIKGKQAIRARLRAGFLGFRPAAFCQVTGI